MYAQIRRPAPVVKILLLLLCTILISCNNKKKQGASGDIVYTCSMDPQVMESAPGRCPICGMDLTAVQKKANSQNDDEIELSPEQIKLGNIRTDSTGQETLSDDMIFSGFLAVDQAKVNSITAKFPGRIEKLYYKQSGDYISKGDRIMSIYSEEVNNLLQEYHVLAEKQQSLGNGLIDYVQLIAAAKNKLSLLGLTENQINEYTKQKTAIPVIDVQSAYSGYILDLKAREGSYIAEGTDIANVADLSTLWVEIPVYSTQLSRLDRKAKATVNIPGAATGMEARIEFINPEINLDSRINLVRLSIANKNNTLKPGMPAQVILKNAERTGLFLPVDAVLRNGKTAAIWIQESPNKFKIKKVTTGLESNGMIEILSGISGNDKVVISGAYLLLSEFVFRNGVNPMEK